MSAFGDAFRRLAVMLSVYEISGRSGVAVALLALVEIGPMIIAAPFTGVLVDRAGKRTSLLRSDLVRALLSLALIPLLLSGSIGGIYLVVAVAGIASGFVEPATHALIPHLVHADELQRANALGVTGRQLALVSGPPLAVAVFYGPGPAVALGIDSLTFIVSAVALLAMTARADATVGEGAHQGGPNLRGFWNDASAGVAYLLRSPLLVGVGLAVAGMSIVVGLNNTAMIFFISRDLGRDPAEIAWLSSVNGLAQVLVGGLLVATARRAPALTVLLLGAATMMLGGTLVALAPTLAVLLVGVVVTSLGNAPFNVGRSSIEQTCTAPSYLGRTRASLELVSNVMFIAATASAGLLVDLLPARAVLIASAAVLGLTFAVTVLIIAPRARPAARSEDARMSAT